MEDAALERLLKDIESDRVERKASASDRSTIRQAIGFGIPLARQACQKNGNPPPEFTVEETRVFATLRRRP